ncbi:MAG: sigma-70 family RNA polymerase sigma factor [Acidobacteria bacterium]|nr:sigma-70 family RNA polymerase sigma factor [Acidobacteriota bacterium]
MTLDDAAAVERARGGDQEAFRVLVDKHSRSLYRLAYRMTGTAEDAEDVVQETFIRAYRQLSRFEARANVSTWLYRIAFNCSVDFLRSRPRRETATEDQALERLAPAATGPTMDDLVYAGQIGERMQVALGELSEKERAAFLMRHYYGCSIEEIGSTLGMKTNATKHSIFRAVKKMRVEMQGLMRTTE